MKQDDTISDLERARHEQLAVALMEHSSIEAAGKACGLSRPTTFRRLKDPQFLAVLRDVRERTAAASLAKLHRLVGKALGVIEGALDDTSAPQPRIAAALKLLDVALRLVELDNIEGRVARLEQQDEVPHVTP